MTARFIVADVMDGLASLETGSVDLVVTSPPFLALRSYLPADHVDKGKEIGSESTPAEFIDTLLKVTAELRRVLAPHGSICVELGDTYAGSGGAGGDYNEDGLRDGQAGYQGSAQKHAVGRSATRTGEPGRSIPGRSLTPIPTVGSGWPLAKSRTLIPSLYQIALAYGFNPLTGQPSPAGQWRIRNVVTWARPNPPVGALGDKWRPATSDLIIACTSGKRYWDDLATRKPSQGQPDVASNGPKAEERERLGIDGTGRYAARIDSNGAGAPLLDYWVIPPGGYTGAHYAVFPEELVVPCVKAMCPERVCRVCGEPSRRIVEVDGLTGVDFKAAVTGSNDRSTGLHGPRTMMPENITRQTAGWSDCGHDNWRPGLVLDCFGGSGTTGVVATGHGHDCVLIDLDERNCELARNRIGPFMFEGPIYVGERPADAAPTLAGESSDGLL